MNKPTIVRMLCVLGAAALLAPAAQAADTYQVDTGHSNVIFRIMHLNISPFYARFDKISGSFKLDDADPAKSSIDIAVDAETVNTKMEKLNEHLRSSDFFSVKEFPKITFKSTKVEAGDEPKTFKVTGDLSLHGVTKSITVTVEKTGETTVPRAGQRCGFETFFTIKRSDYGMDYMLDMLGDEVKLIIGMEGVHKDEEK